MDDVIVNPHDKLFREIWSDKAVAADYLQNNLPDAVLKLIDLNTIEIAKDSFIEKELKDYLSDLLYKVDLAGNPGYVYFLFEHKSYPDKWVHLQLLEYQLKIWRLHQKQHPKEPLPVIIPLVLYHGLRQWNYKIKLSSLMKEPDPALQPYIPDFEFVLNDLTQYSNEMIKGTVLTRVVMLLFKHIVDPDIVEKLPSIFSLMKDIAEAEYGLRYIEAMLRYVASTIDLSHTELKNMVEKSLSQQEGEIIMTLAERWIDKGRLEGKLEGKLEGLQEGVYKELLLSIEQVFKIRFKKQSEVLIALARKIVDIGKLRKIREAALKEQNASALQKLLEQ
jgi:predicted transposase/invertase (TIGR01784 family)